MKLKAQSMQESDLVKLLDRLVNRIKKFAYKIDKIPKMRLEIVILMIYIGLQCMMIYFHEPWFDEAQAWDIARDGSLKEILFEVTHYEGHPALWHLILMPFAKIGCEFNVTISIINLVFMAGSVALILFISPFPRIIRVILPFTYFFAYQYGVVSRPYCMMTLAFLLLAITYKNRNSNPLKYILCLIFLCATSAYGIIMAGGLAIVWVIEIFKEIGLGKMFSDKRCWLLAVLLLYALAIIVRIIPYEDTWAMSIVKGNVGIQLISRLIYVFFSLPSDLFFTSTYTTDYLTPFSPLELTIDSIIGILILFLIFKCAKKKKMILSFLVPYILFGIFCSFVYIYVHHTGIILLFMIFWFWTLMEQETDNEKTGIPDIVSNNIAKNLVIIFISLGMLIPVVWSVGSYVVDIIYEYNFGKCEAEFLEEHDLTDNSIVFNWGVTFDEEEDNKIIDYDLKHIGKMVCISPYGVLNNCVNWPANSSLYTFYHRNITETEKEAAVKLLLENTVPDVQVGEPRWDALLTDHEDAEIYEGLFINTYAMVYNADVYKVWKMTSSRSRSRIYVKRSLLEEKNLKEISYLPGKN